MPMRAPVSPCGLLRAPLISVVLAASVAAAAGLEKYEVWGGRPEPAFTQVLVTQIITCGMSETLA